MGIVRLSGCHPMRCWMSVRDVEEMMAARGVLVSYETVRLVWQVRQQYADGLRGGRARTGDRWRLDEVFLTINGVTHYLWRAVDQNGVVLDILVQPKRDRIGLPPSGSFASCCGPRCDRRG